MSIGLDAVSVNLALVQLCLFGCGLEVFAKTLWGSAKAIDPLAGACHGIACVLTVLMFASFSSVPLLLYANYVVLGVSGLGLWRLLRHTPWGRVWHQHKTTWLGVGLFLGAVEAFWIHNMRDLLALPSYHDGMAHVAFFKHILDYQNPLIFRLPNRFVDLFGPGQLVFYPVGSHTVVALFYGLWVKLGWLTYAQALKGWMLLACTAAPGLALWGSWRLFPGYSRWLYYATGCLGLTWYQYPYWAADSGGFSRCLAQACILPIVVELLRYASPWVRGVVAPSFGTARGWAAYFRAGAWVALPLVGIFYMHPSGFGMYSFSVGLVLVSKLWPVRTQMKLLFKGLAAGGAAVGMGCLWVLVLLYNSGSFEAIDLGHNKQRSRVFSGQALWDRLWNFTYDLFCDFTDSSYFEVSVSEALRLLGWVGVVWGVKRVAKLPRLYALWMLGMSWLIMSCTFLEHRLFKLIGELYYNHPSRLGETYYLAQICLWTCGLLSLGRLIRWGVSFLQSPYQHRIRMAVYVLFAGWFLFDVRTLAVHHRRHVARYYGIYHSPTHSDFDPLVGFLRAHTPKHSTLVYPPFYADVLPAVTGQMGLFMYLECPTVDYITSNCKERMAYGQALAADLERLEQASPPSSGLCLPALDRLPPPVYVIWPTQVLKLREETFAHCKDVQHVGMHGNFAVLAPRDDTGFWRPAHVER